MIYRCGLVGALLPVEQGVSFLKYKVQVVLLQLCELTYLAIFVYEGGIVEILGKGIIRLHIGEWLVESTLMANKPLVDAYLAQILLGCYLRHR